MATFNEPLTDSVDGEDFIVKDVTLPRSMTLVGVVGVHDEIRAESPEALKLAKAAGIQVCCNGNIHSYPCVDPSLPLSPIQSNCRLS